MVDIVHKNLRMSYQFDSAWILAKNRELQSQNGVKSDGQ